MGLDQYAFAVSKKIDLTDDGLIFLNEKFSKVRKKELHYWRKHPSLHGWMENLYVERGGKEEFNCIPLPLTTEDLNRLEEDIINNRLPYTEGFCFGQDASITSNDPEEQEEYNFQKLDDLHFVKKARELLAKDKIVYYDSWW